MKITRRDFLAGAGLAAGASSIGARAARGADLTPGTHPLGLDNIRDGIIYVPQNYRPGAPTPLLLAFHGAGSAGQNTQYLFPLADEFGQLVLAPDSRDERTWDLVLGSYGADQDFLMAAFRSVRARCNVDLRRMAIAGHSDGASYALSFGIGAGDMFQHIMAFSPGVMIPIDVRGKPRIFVSHGIGDPTMPIDDTSRKFVPRLKGLGYDVTYREYDGGHAVPPAIVHDAFEWLAASRLER